MFGSFENEMYFCDMKSKPNHTKILIDKMFEIAGVDKKYEDVKDKTNAWYLEDSMTEEQRQAWINWGISYLMNHNKFLNKKRAYVEMSFFDSNYGLTNSQK